MKDFDAAFGDAIDASLGDDTGKLGWRLRPTPTGDGRTALVSVCGRFRVLAEKSRHARHGVMFRAERRIESPPGNWFWQHVSSHRTEAAAKAACERAARPPRRNPTSTSRPKPAT